VSIYVYIVQGAAGEYEDHTEWDVCAYATRRAAARHARKAKKRNDELAEALDVFRSELDDTAGDGWHRMNDERERVADKNKWDIFAGEPPSGDRQYGVSRVRFVPDGAK